jgi:hypothetical protein
MPVNDMTLSGGLVGCAADFVEGEGQLATLFAYTLTDVLALSSGALGYSAHGQQSSYLLWSVCSQSPLWSPLRTSYLGAVI